MKQFCGIFLCLLISDINVLVTCCPDNYTCSSDAGTKATECQEMSDISDLRNIPSDSISVRVKDSPLVDINSGNFPSMNLLQKLVFVNCSITDFSVGNENLPSITYLDLSSNNLQEFPHALPQTLTAIKLTRNKIENVKADVFLETKHLRELFLDSNRLRSISSESFMLKHASKDEKRETPQQMVLTKLQKLVLNSNRIEQIAGNSFEALPNLYALNLAKNKISKLECSTFSGLHNLEYLDLSRNRISNIEDGSFELLKLLKNLNLKHNKITTIPRGLPMLEWLDLSYNHIKHVSVDFRPEFYAIEMLNLGQNPYHCDCHLLWLKEFSDRREYQVKHLDINKYDFIPSCATPQPVQDEHWDLLADDVFTCDVMVTSSDDASDAEFDASNFLVTKGKVGDTHAHIGWSVKGAPPTPTVIIQYYVFGDREATLKHVQLAILQRGFTLKHLQPQTNYVMCVTPKLKEVEDVKSIAPLSMNHCIEITTKAIEHIQVLSYFKLFCYYVLTSAGTILFILTFIALVALFASSFMKSAEWSSDLVTIDEPIMEEENTHVSGSRKDEHKGAHKREKHLHED